MSESTGAPGGFGATPYRIEPPPLVTPSPDLASLDTRPMEPLEPWISIWSRPRATLRQILSQDSHRSVLLLAALGGIAQSLALGTNPRIGESYSAMSILAIAVGGGAVGGILLLFLFSSPVALAGRWLGEG